MSSAVDDAGIPPLPAWLARIAAGSVVILGCLVFVTFLETEDPAYLGLAALGVGGGLAILGLERPHRRSSRWALLVGWLMMAAFSLTPTSLLFVPLTVVLFAAPAVYLTFQRSWLASGHARSEKRTA